MYYNSKAYMKTCRELRKLGFRQTYPSSEAMRELPNHIAVNFACWFKPYVTFVSEWCRKEPPLLRCSWSTSACKVFHAQGRFICYGAFMEGSVLGRIEQLIQEYEERSRVHENA